jgi:hypothetical protein
MIGRREFITLLGGAAARRRGGVAACGARAAAGEKLVYRPAGGPCRCHRCRDSSENCRSTATSKEAKAAETAREEVMLGA